MSDLLVTFACAGAIILLVAGAEVMRRALAVPGRITRLAVHLGGGTLVALAPLLFTARTWPAILAGLAGLILAGCTRRGWLPSLHAARPGSWGTTWFAVAALILYLAAWERPALVTIPLLVMAFADAAGVIVGEKRRQVLPLPEGFGGKSWDGSVAVFALTGLTVSLGWEAFGLGSAAAGYLVGLICAPVGAVVEALSRRGSDNLTLPLAVAFTLLLITDAAAEPLILLLTEAAALLLAAGALRWRALSPDGAAGAFLLATWLFGGGGWLWTLPLLVFFVLSSLLSQSLESVREPRPALEQKGARRDLAQVAANGGVALFIFALSAAGLPLRFAWPAFLGAVAAATADTWATELGTTFKPDARLVTTWRRVPAGTSGGVTLPGTLAAVGGAAVIGVAGFVPLPVGGMAPFALFLAATAGGVVGMFVDSLLGASYQGRWRCGVCGRITERRTHCGEPVRELRSGWGWLDNDVVNALAGLGGAGAAVLFGLLFRSL